MQENQWPRNPVLTFWQSKRICSDNAFSKPKQISLDAAPDNGWVVVDMKNDWKEIFPPK
jgi:hypothetical protein